MNIDEDMLIVLRAAATLRGLQRSLRLVTQGTPDYVRLVAAVRLMEAQFDEALPPCPLPPQPHETGFRWGEFSLRRSIRDGTL